MKDLGYKSGVYEVILILGDFLIEDSLEWNLGEVNLQVQSGKIKRLVNPLYHITYGMKPEIKVPTLPLIIFFNAMISIIFTSVANVR